MARLAQPWRVEEVEEDKPMYKPKDAIGDMVSMGSIMTTAGFILSGTQNALARENVGAMGVFTRTGSTIAVFAGMGVTYGFFTSAAANLREKDDGWNPAIGGFLAGAVGGLSRRTLPAVLGYGVGLAVFQGTFYVCGNSFFGFPVDPQMDEYERKRELQTSRRRPLQETMAQIGERATMNGPNWKERRADLIKEKYGIDVPRA